MLDMALREFPDDPDFNRMRGELYLAEDDYETALPQFEKALLGAPDTIDHIYNLGAVYFETGKFNKAAPLLERITQYPNDSGLAFMVAYCAFKNGDRVNAGTLLQGLRDSMDDLMQTYPDHIADMLMAYARLDANNELEL
jgi:tetratricopeptide (TPR) repeat protein